MLCSALLSSRNSEANSEILLSILLRSYVILLEIIACIEFESVTGITPGEEVEEMGNKRTSSSYLINGLVAQAAQVSIGFLICRVMYGEFAEQPFHLHFPDRGICNVYPASYPCFYRAVTGGSEHCGYFRGEHGWGTRHIGESGEARLQLLQCIFEICYVCGYVTLSQPVGPNDHLVFATLTSIV